MVSTKISPEQTQYWIKQGIHMNAQVKEQPKPLSANEYQEWTITTAIYPGAGTGNDAELSYLGLGIAGEAGEVADKIKKHLRDGKLDIGGIIYELGDVCWYVARMADALGYDFSDILQISQSKLESRKMRNVLQGEGDGR